MNIDKIYTLRDLKRYNNTPRIKDESVAEHTAFVALIVLQLHKEYDFNVERALKMALTHDLGEIYITDIPHNVKRMFPDVHIAIQNAELQIYKNEFPNYFSYFFELFKGKSIEAKIVQYADILSCKQYTKSEVQLGNKGYMKKVLDETLIRIKEMKPQLKEAKR